MAIDVFAADEQSEQSVELARWTRLARSVLDAQKLKEDVEVSLLFVDEPAMAELRERFVGENGPTDVLAFPIDQEPDHGGRSPDEGGTGPGGGLPGDEGEMPVLLGDVVVCPSVAAKNASGNSVTLEDELALLVVHGLLHLLGMDHENEGEAESMERREQELLDRFHRGTG
jgi:probable rRNA maturation factor